MSSNHAVPGLRNRNVSFASLRIVPWTAPVFLRAALFLSLFACVTKMSTANAGAERVHLMSQVLEIGNATRSGNDMRCWLVNPVTQCVMTHRWACEEEVRRLTAACSQGYTWIIVWFTRCLSWSETRPLQVGGVWWGPPGIHPALQTILNWPASMT